MRSFEIDADGKTVFYRTRSELTEALLQIKDKPIRLDGEYPMFRAIYDGDYPSMVLMTCRQIGKSTTLSNFSIAESVAVPHFSTLFLAPSKEQTQKFSTERVGKTIQYSPYIQKYYLAEKSSERVLLRTFSNGSSISFSYVLDDPDRVRGVSADRVCYDECQDMLLDVVAPVINETMRNSKYRYDMYCGTPKTFENCIQSYWENSTQTEWVIKCDACNKHNAIRSEKAFGPVGPICRGCAALLNPRRGQWIDFKPGAKMKGFHISRAMMPGNVPAAWRPSTDPKSPYQNAVRAWADIWDSLTGANAYPISTFRNEVVGVSDSQGRRLVTIEDLRAMCTGPRLEQKPNPLGNLKGVLRICAGIDWSGGGTDEKSNTVLTIWGLLPGARYRLLWFKVYPGMNPLDEAKDIMDTLAMYSTFTFVAGDAGEGNVYIDLLRKRFGPKKVVKLRYVDSSYYVRWDEAANAYMVNRTRAIDSAMMAFKRGEFEFPTDPDTSIMKKPFDHILAEHEEMTGQEGGIRKKVWRHAKNQPDDFLHALVFGRVAMQMATGEIDLTV
jgi:hypothetical protein